MRRVFVIAGLIAGLTASTGLADRTDDGVSPLQAAQLILTRQPQAELAAWQAMTAAGLPIIAEHPHDEDLARLTFAYRGHDGISEVRLDSVINAHRASDYVSDYRSDFTLPLQRFAGTDIWTLQIDVRRDVQAVYSFLVSEGTGVYRRSDPENPRRLRGRDAESLIVLDQVRGRAAWRPVSPRLHSEPVGSALMSAALGRTVMLQTFPAERPDAPVLILYDAFLWGVRAPAWEVLRNLRDAGEAPDMHLVLIDQLDPGSADKAYADQARFVADELLPHLRAEIGLTTVSADIVIGGASRRGLAASVIALTRPDAIGGVLSMSGSYYWAPEGQPPEWLPRRIGHAGAGAPRFYLAAGALEFVHTSTNRGHVMLDANRNMAAALERNGHDVTFDVFAGGHDVAGWRGALADGVRTLFGPPAD